MVCKSLLDLVRRGGRSLGDIAAELSQFGSSRYELVHKQLKNPNLLESKLGNYEHAPNNPFWIYEDPKGYCGATVSNNFIIDFVNTEYSVQKDYLSALQKGVFGQYYRCDHTRAVAKKVELLTGAMWSHSVMNEYWQIVSWLAISNPLGRIKTTLFTSWRAPC